YATAGAVERNPVAALEHFALHAHLALLLVDVDFAGAGHAALTHAACYDRSVARHAAARGQNARPDFHAVNIFWRGLARTSMTLAFLSLWTLATASSAVNTICPTAAPGDAGRPFDRTSTFTPFS